MPLKDKNILAIDDTASIRTFLRISLQAHGAAFHEAGTAQDGLDLCKTIKPDLVVLDLGLPDKDGLEVLPELRKESPDSKVIILSVRKDQKTQERAAQLGAHGYMSKPFLMEDLIEVVHETLQTTPPM